MPAIKLSILSIFFVYAQESVRKSFQQILIFPGNCAWPATDSHSAFAETLKNTSGALLPDLNMAIKSRFELL
jgi:hypothetical protein